jgi:hypothetical protein
MHELGDFDEIGRLPHPHISRPLQSRPFNRKYY